MARYCVGSVDSSTAVLGSAVHYSPVRYSETVLTSVGTRRRRRRSTHAHNTSAHTTVPPPHTRPMSRHECIPDPPVPGREPAHSARAEDVSPIRRSGPDLPTRPARALPRDRTPEFARRGPDRAAAVEPPPGAASSEIMCPRDEATSRRNAARGRAGREGPGARRYPPERETGFLIVMARSLLQFSHGIPTI